TGIASTSFEQLEGAEDGETGFDQRQKLLVVDQELVERDFAPAALAAQAPLHPHGLDEIALRQESLPQIALGIGALDLAQALAAVVQCRDDESWHLQGETGEQQSWLIVTFRANPAGPGLAGITAGSIEPTRAHAVLNSLPLLAAGHQAHPGRGREHEPLGRDPAIGLDVAEADVV